jgi:HPt (histidine-containing phosphotransfer) domain-containing protein
MSQPLSEYFAREAGDFLDELDALLAASDTPDSNRLFRLARGVRGSAQIAGVEGVARVAERLEDAARSVRDGSLAWDGALGERVKATAADLRRLVASHADGGPGDEALAAAAEARWEGTGAHHRVDDGAPPEGRCWSSCGRRSAAWWTRWTARWWSWRRRQRAASRSVRSCGGCDPCAG